jgi:hypothetical protein
VTTQTDTDLAMREVLVRGLAKLRRTADAASAGPDRCYWLGRCDEVAKLLEWLDQRQERDWAASERRMREVTETRR